MAKYKCSSCGYTKTVNLGTHAKNLISVVPKTIMDAGEAITGGKRDYLKDLEYDLCPHCDKRMQKV